MRIAVFHHLPSGGARRALFEWLRRLRADHDLILYTYQGEEQAPLSVASLVSRTYAYRLSYRLDNRPLTPLGLVGRFEDLGDLQQQHRRIAADIDQGAFDVALVNHCRYTQAPFLLRYLKLPTVYYCQEPPRWLVEPAPARSYNATSHPGLHRAARLLFRATFRKRQLAIDTQNTRQATQILANSHYSCEVMYRTYGRFARYSPLGVDSQQFRPLDLPRRKAVLSVGALAPVKGHDFVINAVARIPSTERPDVILVADRRTGAEKAYLQTLAAGQGVALEIREAVSEDELVRLYNQVSLTICASVLEPFGLVPLESLACGTPVVAVREGGFRESVDDSVTGYLCERDTDEMAHAMCALLRDDGARTAMGQAGRQHVIEAWNWDRSALNLAANLAQTAAAPR